MDNRSYLGGLVTGEGSFCFGVMKRKGKDGYRIVPIFALFMADRETILDAAGRFKEIGLSPYVQERSKANQLGIHINGMKRCRRYCETLLPYLVGQKLRAAELMLEFIESRESKSPRSPYSPEEIEIVRQSRENNGNTRGRKNPL